MQIPALYDEIYFIVWVKPVGNEPWMFGWYEDKENAVKWATHLSMSCLVESTRVVSMACATENLLVKGKFRDPRDP